MPASLAEKENFYQNYLPKSMNNLAFSKIWISIILIIFVVGVILVWQYLLVPEEKAIPEEEIKSLLEEKKLATIPEKYLPLSYITFSPDGTKVAYVGKEEDGELVIVNDKKGKIYDRIWGLTFSPDGKQIAYKAQSGEKYLIIINDRESELYNYVNEPVFSPDSKQIGYLAGVVSEDKEEYFIVVNDRKIKPTSAIFQRHVLEGPIFSPDGKIVYKVFKGEDGKEHWVINGKETKGYDWLGAIIFSPNGERIAYLAQEAEGGYFWVVDGKESEPFDTFTTFTFSPDSSKIAYAVKRGEYWFAVINEEENGPYDGIVWEIVFSPDSKRVAYHVEAENDGPNFIVVDGQEGKAYWEIWGPPVFSPDSKHLAYKAGTISQRFIVIDGKEHKAFNEVSGPIFSPDGKLVYGAMIRTEKDWPYDAFVVIDEQEGEIYNLIFSPPEFEFYFSPDGKYIAYGAFLSGNEVWWIVDEIE